MKARSDMRKPLNVLVPLDGSSHADRGLRPARRIAAALGLGVGAVTVASAADDLDESVLEEAVADQHLDWSTTALSVSVADAIADVAREHDAMVCMATHGHGRSVALIGSIPEDVVRQSSLPVLLVGPSADVYEDGPIREFVVAVSGDESDDTVCGVAVEWAAAYDLDVRFVTVVQSAPAPVDATAPSDRWFGPAGDEHLYVADLVLRFERSGVDVAGEVVHDAVSVAGGLAQFMRSTPGSVLVVGTHGRTGMPRFVHGSVASKIVAASSVPVLMLPLPVADSRPAPGDAATHRATT